MRQARERDTFSRLSPVHFVADIRTGQTVKEKKRVSRRYLCTLLRRLVVYYHDKKRPGIKREQEKRK